MVDENSSGPVDPHQLLKALSPLLNSDGGAKGIPEVVRITNLMKESTKLVSRCVYISVLRATMDDEILQKFIKQGGWDILNIWLQENKAEDCYAFLVELLKLYQKLPVTIDLLKKNNCAKTVKQLSKTEDERVKALSMDIVTQWMDKIKSKSGEDSKLSEASKHKHKHHHHKEKHREKSSKDGDKEHHKKPSPHKDHSHQSRTRRDSIGENQPSREEQKESANSSKHHRLSQDGVAEKSKSSAKVAPHKFRTTGLEQENVLPPSKKKKSLDKTATKRSSTSKLVPGSQPPEKKPKQSVSTTPNTTTVSPSGKANIHIVKEEETHGKIKLIPAKPKPPQKEVYESSGFMDAITTSYVPAQKPKKKKPASGNKTSGKGPTSPTSPTPGATSPNGKDRPAMPSFYKDTLEMPTSPVEDDNGEKSVRKETDSKGGEVKEEDGKDDDTKSVVSDASSESSKKKKKKVTWASDSDLKSFFYFELDETERVNVNKIKSFEDIKKQEMMMERRAIESAKKLHDTNAKDATAPGCIPWRTPVLLTGINLQTNFVPGCNSTEIETQRQREEGVLQALFFSKHMIPDTAHEPEPEEVEYMEPKNIPLEDESGGGETFMDFSSYPASQPTADKPTHPTPPQSKQSKPPPPNQPPPQDHNQSGNPQFSLPPDIANMLSSMANHYQNNTSSKSGGKEGNPASEDSTGTSSAFSNGDLSQGLPPDMHNMLQSIVGNNQSNSDDDEWYKQVKKMVEPYKDQIQDILQQQQQQQAYHAQGTQNSTGGGGPHPGSMNSYPPGAFPVPPGMPPHTPMPGTGGEGLLGNGPGMPYGPPGMPPPPHNFMGGPMRGPPPPLHLMPYGPGPGGPGGPGGPMFRGRGPRSMGPMRGGRGGHRQSGKPVVCRNFMRGKCQRGKSCNYYHPPHSNNTNKNS